MSSRNWILVGLLALSPAIANANLLMMVEGVPGTATLAGYGGWFSLESLSWSIERPDVDANVQRSDSVPLLPTMTISLRQSANLAVVAQASGTGAIFRKIVFDNVSVGAAVKLASRLTCENAEIRSFASTAEAGDGRSNVELSIRCGKLTWEFFDYNDQGALVRSSKGTAGPKP